MLEYLKYLPLTQLVARHPKLVALVNQLISEVTPHLPEIQQVIAEAEGMLRQIHPQPMVMRGTHVETVPVKKAAKRRTRRNSSRRRRSS